MLNKAICRKCWNEFAISSGALQICWQEEDDKSWEAGKVFCYAKGRTVSIGKQCHEDCPYSLEHLMSETKQ